MANTSENLKTTCNFDTTNKINGIKNDNFSEQFEEIKISTANGFIAGKWWGSRDKQPIIAVHGWQDNAGTFDNLAPLLVKEGHSLLCIEMPGHGYSFHYPPGVYYYIFWDGLIWLRRVIKHFNWTLVDLMGHSMGGAIAFLYASAYPTEVNNYISLDIASPAVRRIDKVITSFGSIVDEYIKLEAKLNEPVRTSTYNSCLEAMQFGQGNSCTENSCEILLRRGMVPVEKDIYDSESEQQYKFCRDIRLKAVGLGLMSIEDALRYASRIQCRCLNIKATRNSRNIDLDYYQRIIDQLKQTAKVLEYHEVDGEHHLHLNLESCNTVAQIIINFLAKS